MLAVVLASGAVACSDDGGSDEALCALVEDAAAFEGRFGQGLDPTDTERALDQLAVGPGRLDPPPRRRAVGGGRRARRRDAPTSTRWSRCSRRSTRPIPAGWSQAVNALDDERAAAEVAGLELQGWAREHLLTTRY